MNAEGANESIRSEQGHVFMLKTCIFFIWIRANSIFARPKFERSTVNSNVRPEILWYYVIFSGKPCDMPGEPCPGVGEPGVARNGTRT